MTTENSNAANDLDAFSADFYGTSKTEEQAPSLDDADDTSIEEDTLAPEETDEADAEPEDNEGDDGADEEPVEQPKKKQSASERIREINAKYRAEQRRAEQLQRELEEARASKAKTEEKPTPPVATDTGAPDPDALNEDGSPKYPLGEFDAQYLRDNARYILKEERDRQAREDAEAALAQAKTQLHEGWASKLDEAEATDDMADIRELGADLVNAMSHLPEDYGDFLASTIMSMEKGVEVFYYLAKNIDEARRIVAMSPTKATIALGRIEGKFIDAPQENGKQSKPRVSKAPEPPQTVNRGTNGRFEIPDDTQDLDAFERKFYKK